MKYRESHRYFNNYLTLWVSYSYSCYSSCGSYLCPLNRGGEMRGHTTIDNKYIKYDMREGKAALFVATEIRGNIRRLRGVEGMANWRPGGPFQWLRPLVCHDDTTINRG